MQAISAAPRSVAAEPASFELLLFRLGGNSEGKRSELFGVHVFHVREILAMPPVTVIAGARAPIMGVINLRGQVLHVLDLPAMAACTPASGHNILLVTEMDGAAQAFAVEAVEEIVVLGFERLVAGNHGGAGGMVSAIARLDDCESGARLAQVLDMGAVLRRLRG